MILRLQVGPAAAVSAYTKLMEDCWAQDPLKRPTFDQVIMSAGLAGF